MYFSQESKRLIYRKLTLEDTAAWKPFFEDNPMLDFVVLDKTKSAEENAKLWIERQMERYDDSGLGMLAICLKESDKLIGIGGIVPRDIQEQQEYEIGYLLLPKFWGKGYATEMAQTMRNYADLYIETERVISIIEAKNKASANVATKNGMKKLFDMEYHSLFVDVYGVNLNPS